MAELTPDIVADVVAACQSALVEAGEAFSRTLDQSITVQVDGQSQYDPTAALDGEEPGLSIVLTVGSTAALVLLPESSGLLPTWYAAPDPTGQSKLMTLAQELGMLLLPESAAPSEFKAARVESLAGALKRAGVSTGAAVVQLKLTSGDRSAVARMIWPAATPAAVFEATAAPRAATETPQVAKAPAPQQPGPAQHAPARPTWNGRTLDDLPTYTRSLLKIKVPVMVTLASKKQSLGQVIELGPGSIIQFDKSCEEMLDMEAAGHRVAQGEAVKIGDKFGLRITSVVMPDERFVTLGQRG